MATGSLHRARKYSKMMVRDVTVEKARYSQVERLPGSSSPDEYLAECHADATDLFSS
jgi:hypothetical protein